MSKFKTPSYSSPKGGRRGCLCENGKYSTKCCDGNLQSQGVGVTQGVDVVSTSESAGVRVIVRQNG